MNNILFIYVKNTHLIKKYSDYFSGQEKTNFPPKNMSFILLLGSYQLNRDFLNWRENYSNSMGQHRLNCKHRGL